VTAAAVPRCRPRGGEQCWLWDGGERKRTVAGEEGRCANGVGGTGGVAACPGGQPRPLLTCRVSCRCCCWENARRNCDSTKKASPYNEIVFYLPHSAPRSLRRARQLLSPSPSPYPLHILFFFFFFSIPCEPPRSQLFCQCAYRSNPTPMRVAPPRPHTTYTRFANIVTT
jgi:hypothetical protein